MSLISYENLRAVINVPFEKNTNDVSKLIMKSRKFLAWGDKTIIDTLSQFSKVKGGPIVMPEVGVHGRGGSYYDEGIWMVD
jgi:hypothetical protein